MEPPPSVSKACSMVARVERQIIVHCGLQDVRNNSSMTARVFRDVKALTQQRHYYSDQNQDPNGVRNGVRTDLICSHCGKLGHVKEFCYKIIGYPENWWSGSRRGQRPYDGSQNYQRNQNSPGSSPNYTRPQQSNYGRPQHVKFYNVEDRRRVFAANLCTILRGHQLRRPMRLVVLTW